MISVRIENVSKRFGKTVALEQVTVTIAPGEIFFLLGPSGCGKTTLLRMVAGFYAPDEGRIFFDSLDVTRVPPHLRQTAMMFQSYALWPHLTVARNVSFGLEERRLPAGETRQRVAEALASVQMGEYAERRIHQLSGGQQQRVALARALVVRPRCLLLDEPLSNLDAKLRIEMRTEIRRICRDFGLTVIYVTHDQKEALSIADKMALLDAGRIKQIGTPAEIYRHPQSRFVAEFMGASNFIAGLVRDVDGAGANVETPCGTFRASLHHPGWRPAKGERCILSIRPETWQLSSEKRNGNSITGRILERVYLGEMAQYTFAAGEHRFKIYELNPRFIEISETRELSASAAPEDVIALPG